MKKVLLLIFAMVFLISCSNHVKGSNKFFNTKKEAIENAVKEDPNIQGVIDGTPNNDKEWIMIYKFKEGKKIGIGTATIILKNDKYAWINNGNGVIIKQPKGKTNVHAIIKSVSGKKYKFYAGIVDNPNKNVVLNNEIKPTVDRKLNIYYYLAELY